MKWKFKIFNASFFILFFRNFGGVLTLVIPGLSFISAAAGPLFLLLTFKRLKIVDLFLVFLGLIFIFIEPRSFRVLLSLLTISIFFSNAKFDSQQILHSQLKYFTFVMSLLFFLGLFVPSFYDPYWFGARYCFFYDDATLLGAYLMPFVALNIYYLELAVAKRDKVFSLFALSAVLICLVATMSRMYIFLGMISLFSYLYFFKRRIFSSIFILFILLLLFISTRIDWEALFYSMRLIGDDGGFSLTGRAFIWQKFYEHFSRLSFFELFVPTLSTHLLHLNLELGAEGHSMVENSYYMVFLGGGMLFSLYFLYVLFIGVSHLILIKHRLSILFIVGLLGVWFFDDSLAYPFSVFSQMFAFYVFYCLDLHKNQFLHQ